MGNHDSYSDFGLWRIHPAPGPGHDLVEVQRGSRLAGSRSNCRAPYGQCVTHYMVRMA